jgi:hypothetical protein
MWKNKKITYKTYKIYKTYKTYKTVYIKLNIDKFLNKKISL